MEFPEKKKPLEKIGCFSAALRCEDIPREVLEKAKTCVFDALECCLSAYNDQRKKGTYQIIRRDLPGFQSTLFGARGKASAEDAAFYNIVTGSISARNEINMDANGHPGTILIPSAIAAAEDGGASGRALLESIVASYETSIRFGKLIKASQSIPAGFRRAAFSGAYGCAIASAKVWGFSASETASAAAMSLNCLCGLNEWRIPGTGEDVFQNAFVARAGIYSARLAGAGIEAALGNMDGEFGILNIFGVREKSDVLFEGLGKEYLILTTKHKPVGACLSIQAPCQLAEKFVSEDGVTADQVEEIIVQVPERLTKMPWYGKKDGLDNPVFSIMSIPFGMASTIDAGGLSGIEWMPPYNDRVTALMSKCRLLFDDYAKEHLGNTGFRATIYLKNGKILQKEQFGFEPLNPRQVEERFLYSAEHALGREKAQKAAELIHGLEQLDNISELTECLNIVC